MSADDANTRPSKRARLSPEQDSSALLASPSTPSLSNLKHHPEFWFDDGNIVLIAQHTGFRIFRTLLAAQSTVFADMFASSSSRSDETLDGCPVVHLTDSPNDLGHLLRILLPTSPMCYITADPEVVHSFDEVFAVVRLAHKYGIQSVQDHAIRALQEYHFPSEINNFFGPPKKHIFVKSIHCIGAVNLARLTDTPLMLPTALYGCSYVSGRLLSGWTREDGTIEHLSTDDLKRCFDARIALGQEQALLPARLFSAVPPERCTSHRRCAPYIAKLVANVAVVEALVKKDALCDLSSVISQLNGMCGGCTQVLLERHRVERKRIWDTLPQIFGIVIEGWAKPGGEGAGNAP
ncbi:hypothetical protein LXA43DRAFT_37169 [Ganoderma leucocontextum]|nr:hypothetical protein LXA43DRAFT_37169 [Ganoderma leucocontextum]